MKRLIKIILMIILSLYLSALFSLTAYAESNSSSEEISSQVNDILYDYNAEYTYEDMEDLSLSGLISAVIGRFSDRLQAPFRLLGTILISIVFSSFMLNTADTVLSDNSSQRLYSVICVVTSAAAIIPTIITVYENSTQALERGSEFMLAFVPVYAGLAMASGSIVSSGIYNTLTLAGAELIVQLSAAVIMPLAAMTAALSITGSVFTTPSVDGITAFIRKLVTWGLTISMTLFSGFVSMKSTLGNTVDGFAAKSVKFVVSGLVPIAGSAVTDAYSTVKGSFEVMKCTAGTAGTVTAVLLMLPPILEVLAFRFVLTAGASAAELFSVKPLEKLLKGLDSGLAMILSVLVCFSVLFVISTAILMRTL